MRVGLIAPPWLPVPPPAYGGSEVVIDLLARGLQDAGHDVVLFAHAASTCDVTLRSAFSEKAELPIGNCAHELHHALAAYDALSDVDVIHDHTLAGPLLAKAHLTSPAPAVVTTNHGPFNDVLGPIYSAVADRLPIVAISESQAAPFGRHRVARVIHHGLNVEEFPFGQGDGGYVLFLGRMAPEKGVHLAVRAARRAGARLVVAAKMREPAERSFFAQEVEPFLGGGVEYIGEADASAKRRLLAGASALLNPICWEEPFGMVMIESLACGTPVIVTRRGAAPEIVEHGVTGFICDDEHDLGSALTAAAGLDRRRCRASVVERFSAQRMVAAHVELYTDVLEGRVLEGRSLSHRLRPPLGALTLARGAAG
ncbi:MAG: glycosyltransferase family 4 protein [Acidimicrobiales bacterium]